MRWLRTAKAPAPATRLDELTRFAVDTIIVTDADGRIAECSESAVASYGYSREELLALHIAELRPPAQRDSLAARLEEAAASGGAVYETCHMRRDGSVFPVEISLRAVPVAGRTYYQGIIRDISQRKTLERELEESRRRLATLLDNLPGMAFRCANTPAWRMEFVSSGCEELTGYAPADLVGDHAVAYGDLIHADDRRRVWETIQQGVASGEPYRVTYRITTASGEPRTVWEQGRGVPAPGGAAVALEGFVADVTGRARAEDALRESEARQQALFASDVIGTMVGDASGTVVEANDAFLRLLGYERRDLTTGVLRWKRLTPPEFREIEEERLAEARDRGACAPYEKQLIRRDGSRVWVLSGLTMVGPGRTDLMAFVVDLTERKRAEEALRRSERLYRALFDSANDGVMLLQDQRFVACNDAAARLLGRTRDDIVGCRPDQLSPLVQPDENPSETRARELVDAALAGASQFFEWEHLRPDGSAVLTEVSLKRVELGGEELVQAIVRDISARKLSENVLRETVAGLEDANEKLRLLVEGTAYHFFYVRDLDRRVTYISPSVETITGRDVREWLGRSGFFITSNPVNEAGAAALERHLEGSFDSAPVLLEIEHADGRPVMLELFEEGRFLEGKLVGVQGVAHDITARERAIGALRDSEARYRAFFEDDLTGDFIAGGDGLVIACNPAFAKMFGFASVEDACWRPVEQLFGAGDGWAAFVERLHRERQLFYFEQELRRTDGSPVHVIGNAIGSFDGHGRLASIKGYLFDVTAHRRTEEQLRHAQKMEALGRMAGGVAHDFNNLLQAMLSTVQLLRGGERDPSVLDGTALELEQLILRGGSLARQLLLFAQRGVTRPERLDLEVLVSEASGFLSRLLPDNIRLITELAGVPLPLEADRGQLEQVLTNLVVNASDAMPKGGTLTLRTGRTGSEQCWFEVQDTGIGMSEDVKGLIFEPFFTTKEAGRGTGLGLSVVNGIVSRHGGRVEVTSAPGMGSRFRVTFPSRDSGVFRKVPEAEVQRHPAGGSGERILLVEDNPDVRRLFNRALSGLGYEVVPATSAEEALALPDLGGIDLLVSDISLPGISGLDLVRALEARAPALRVILMSGYADDEVLRRDITDHAVRFLQKPVDLRALAAEVRACLDE